MGERGTNGVLLLRLAGLVVWICAGINALRYLFGSHSIGTLGIARWATGFVLFGVLFWQTSKAVEGASARANTGPLLALQSLAVLLEADCACTGVENVLLIVVAIELGFMLTLRAALTWTAAQTAAMLLILLSHWDEPLDSVRWA